MDTEDLKATPKANREYKDSVFVDLFYDSEFAIDNLRSLYEAIHGIKLGPDEPIKKIRLEKPLYMNFRNDVSFMVGNKIVVLAEHQSTVNYNMPIRDLIYVARIYEKLIDSAARFKKEQMQLPAPEFYVFYNGDDKFPKEKTLRLSDAFNGMSGMLDLEVKVYNINLSSGSELLEKCKTLKDYSLLVRKIKENCQAGLSREDAIKKAIKDCCKEDVLTDYLLQNGSEVCNMFMEEYDYKEDIRVQREEAYETALKKGAQGIIKMGIKGKCSKEEILKTLQEELNIDAVRALELWNTNEVNS